VCSITTDHLSKIFPYNESQSCFKTYITLGLLSTQWGTFNNAYQLCINTHSYGSAVPSKFMALWSSKIFKTINPMTQNYIPDDLNPQVHCYGNLKFWTHTVLQIR
jgi:hypothetical protein